MGDVRDFPETHWSRLLELRDPDHPRHREHLEGLARQYWMPAYHYIRAIRGISPGEAEDLTQQFFVMLLSRGSLGSLSPDRGSFRGFLKTALRRLVASADRARAAREPKDGMRVYRFEEAEAHWQDARKRQEPGPEEAFDREWARGVLAGTVNRLREELGAEGKPLLAELFREYCLEPAEGVSYESLAARHGVSLDTVRNGLREARQRGREILKETLRDYLFPGEDVEEELRFILAK